MARKCRRVTPSVADAGEFVVAPWKSPLRRFQQMKPGVSFVALDFYQGPLEVSTGAGFNLHCVRRGYGRSSASVG